jgi:uncharacterized protein (DUF433 family)
MSESIIICDPKILSGRPVIAGTRISVDLLLEKLGNGESIEQILEAHPRLTRESVLAAIRYAAQLLRCEVVYPIDARPA